ncbi:MAG: hypothetical protein LC119_13465, partial [Burkholderiales bacterium]|nr:hypothetical protein [Burkholderiales bacterium]
MGLPESVQFQITILKLYKSSRRQAVRSGAILPAAGTAPCTGPMHRADAPGLRVSALLAAEQRAQHAADQ